MDTTRIIELKALVQRENEEREQIMNSPEYVELTKQIDELMEKQTDLVSRVGDHSIELNAERMSLINYMKDNNLREYNGFHAVVKKKNEVNVGRVFHVLENDIDNLIVIASISQKSLKDFAKTDDRKKDLLECIEEVGEEIADVNFPSSES